ncbi:MAG: HugZ family protein [Pelagimonas sp.]|uniref:HugZ family pyridoxamine 5'-phosphate oxidase n=1 Tax=Pelagimonas sp. TaxID=2073170 RepID=UPI003D6B5B10
MTSPIRPTDDQARDLARDLIKTARFGALAVIGQDGMPMVTRIATVPGLDGMPLSLVSDLSTHTQALKHNPTCALMLGEPGDKGDPLTHPRLSLQGRAGFIRHGQAEHSALSDHYLSLYPKAKLYIGFGDFSFLRLNVVRGFLNGGFGKAFELTANDLAPNAPPRGT